MMEETKELKDYLEAFRKRRFSVLVIAGVLLSISLAIAMLWPPAYRSTATILIEEQGIPPELIRSTITSYATQRIQVISQRVMTRTNLMQVVEKYNLYPDKRGSETTEEILERMRKDIKMEMINADVIDPRSGRPTQAAIAFTLSFDGRSPGVAQQVANELTSLYLNENLKSRTEKAMETTAFLTDESDKLAKEIAELEAKLAAFKRKNASSLPELAQFNILAIDRTERDLLDLESQIRVQEDRKINLAGQLDQISPMTPMFGEGGERILDPGSKLKMLRSEYISTTSRYSPDHPDVIRLKREIEALEKKSGSVDSSIEQAKELTRLRDELTAAREKYSADHPDIIRLTKAVAAQEEALKQRPPASPEMDAAKENPENPAYINIKSQLAAVKSDLQSLIVKRGELKAKVESYEMRVALSPEVEREYSLLKRDYENSVRRYQETKSKQMDAETGQQLEKERKGERFSLIDPPQLPEEPVTPNRPAIIILGFLLSIAGGIGYAAVAESLDSSVSSASRVMSLLNAPPLSVIPYMRNSEDIARINKTKRMAVVAFAGSLVLLVVLVHLFWTPIDVLWFKGLRKVDTVIGG